MYLRKEERQKLIKSLVKQYELSKQEDFVDYLDRQGVEVTQATISRDIKELDLIKVPGTKGGYRYTLPSFGQHDFVAKLKKAFKDAYLSMDIMDKFITIKTVPGSAHSLGNLIEKNFEDLFSVITSDETALLIAHSKEEAEMVKDTLISYL